MTTHLDYEELADLAEGLLDEARAASAQRHVDECPECRRRAAEVAGVSRVLGETPTPPMPPELVARIDTALAAESGSSVGSGRSMRDRWPRFQLLAAAAAAVAVLVGGVVTVGTVFDTTETNGSGVAAPERGSDTAAGDEGGLAVRTPSSTGPRGVAPSMRGSVAIRDSGTSYRQETLAHQVADVLRSRHEGDAAAPQQAKPGEKMMGCVARVGEGERPELVDSATYGGEPATVIVLPAEDPGRLDVWVVGTECSRDRVDLRERVTMARPG